jgi:hypothetical protein
MGAQLLSHINGLFPKRAEFWTHAKTEQMHVCREITPQNDDTSVELMSHI